MAKKPFKETKLGAFLASKGFKAVLDTVGSAVPGVKLLDTIKDMVLGESPEVELTPEERAHFLELMKLEQQALDAQLADIKSAREMQVVALGQEDIFSKRFVYYFISFWSLFCAGFIVTTTLHEIPEPNMRLVDTTQGFILGTAISSMFAFLLGSTLKSQVKDRTISAMATTKATS